MNVRRDEELFEGYAKVSIETAMGEREEAETLLQNGIKESRIE